MLKLLRKLFPTDFENQHLWFELLIDNVEMIIKTKEFKMNFS